MKSADLKKGVLYAYRQGTYGGYSPVVVLDTSRLWRRRFTGFGADKNAPLYQRFLDRDVELHGKRCGDRNGYLAVSFEPAAYVRDSPENKAFDPHSLLKIGEVKVGPSEQVEGQIHAVKFRLIDPRWIAGEWDEVVQAVDDEKVRRANIEAEKKAESDERVAKAKKRVEALRALNLPGHIETPFEKAPYRYTKDWEPPKYDQRLTRQVVLSMAQVDALLSLIPEGITYRDPDVEDDGWTLRKPEYDN